MAKRAYGIGKLMKARKSATQSRRVAGSARAGKMVVEVTYKASDSRDHVEDIERQIAALLAEHRDGMPGLVVIRKISDSGVARAEVSRAIAHSVARGDLVLDGQHNLHTRHA